MQKHTLIELKLATHKELKKSQFQFWLELDKASRSYNRLFAYNKVEGLSHLQGKSPEGMS